MGGQRPFASPFVVLALGIAAVSTGSLFIRYAQAGAPSLAIAAWRMTLAWLALLPGALLWRRDELRALTLSQWRLALLSGAFLAVHFATWISSLAYTNVASSVVLVDTAPLWVALAAPLIGERIERSVWLGLALALFGCVWVAASDICSLSAAGLACPPAAQLLSGQAIGGDFLALMGALAAAGYLLAGRKLRPALSLLSYVFLVYGAAAAALLLLLAWLGIPLLGYSSSTFGWFLLLALAPQLLGHSSYNWALGYLPAAYVSLVLLGEPVASTILAWLFLGEIPGILRLAGIGLILGGLALSASRTNG